MKCTEFDLETRLEEALFDGLIARESAAEQIARRCAEQGCASLSLGQQLAYRFFIHPVLCRKAQPARPETGQGWASPASAARTRQA